MIINKLFDIECSTDEAIELEHLMWGTQICRTCAGNSVGDYAIRIQELEQQITSAHRQGWEQAKREAVKVIENHFLPLDDLAFKVNAMRLWAERKTGA